MYQTQKNQIRGLSAQEFTALKELCRLSKNMYNVALYNVCQYFFAERKRLSYESNYHLSKEKVIKEVRIHPKYNAIFFEVEYVYKQEPEPKQVDRNIALAIDF